MRISGVVLAIACMLSPMAGQVPATSITPDTDGGIHIGSRSIPMGAVNPSTGNLTLMIPLASLPGRNGHGFNLNLVYDSKIWTPQVTTYPEIPTDAIVNWTWERHSFPVGGVGWHLNLPSIVYPTEVCPGDYTICETMGQWIVTLPDGTKHSITAGDTGTGSWDAEDGSGLRVIAPYGSGAVTVVESDGTVINFGGDVLDTTGWHITPTIYATTITDRNGNVTTITSAGITDSSGHSIQFLSSATELTGIQYPDADGNPRTISFGYTSIPFLSTTPGNQYTTPANPFAYPVDNSGMCGRCLDGYIHVDPVGPPGGNNAYMLSSITFPSSPSEAMSFQYNGYGEMISTTYPTHGYARYDYGVFNHYVGGIDRVTVSADFREVVAQYLCTSSTCTSSQEIKTQWAPSISFESNGGMTETAGVGDPSSVTTVFAFEAYDGVPAAEKLRQIKDSSGTIVKQVTTHNAIEGQSQYLLPDSVTTWLCNGSSSQTTTTTMVYDTAQHHVMAPHNVPMYYGQAATLLSETLQQVTLKKIYDYVTSPACSATATPALGALLRQESAAYLSSDTTYGTQSTAHIPALLSSSEVLDASNIVVAQSTYEFDVTSGAHHAALVTTSGAAQHVTPNGGTHRGNVTAVTKLVDASSSISTYLQYNELGQLVAAIDPNGNATSYTYDSTYYAPIKVTLPQTMTAPQTTPVDHVEYYAYSPYSGDLTSHNDQNSASPTDSAHRTSYTYDSLLRLQQVDSPDGGQTTFTFNPNWSLKRIKDGPTSYRYQCTLYDGLGRQVQSQTLTSSVTSCALDSPTSGTMFADSVYDVFGRVWEQSNPYYAGETKHNTTNQYDVLGRTVLVTEADGNTRTAQYTGSSVDSWDETSVHMQHTSDALGRLVNVMELGTPTSAFSLATDYVYDTLGNLKSVAQHGNGIENARTRSFTYDFLSRLITSANPETGTVCYGQWSGSSCTDGYDPNGNLKHKTDARGATVNYSYDALNRLVAKSYSGTGAMSAVAAATAPVAYVYDAVTGVSVPNSIGRLVTEVTGTLTSPITQRSILNYDVMGRATQETQCVIAAGCSASPHVFQYTYDVAGDVTSANNGVATMGIGLTYAYDPVGRLKSVESTWDDATHPAKLFEPPSSPGTDCSTSVTPQYCPAGLASAAIGMATGSTESLFALQRQYDNRMRISSETDSGRVMTSPGSVANGSITVTGTEVQAVTATHGTLSLSFSSYGVYRKVCHTGTTSCVEFAQTSSDSLMLTVDGFTVSSGPVSYGTTFIVHSLITALSVSTSPVTASPGGSGTLILVSKATGAASNYPITISFESNDLTCGVGGSFTMAGGVNAHAADAGTVTATVNGITSASVPWGTASNASGMAGALRTAIQSVAGGIVTVSPPGSGSTINIVSNAVGASSNYAVSVSVTDTTAGITSPSFVFSATSLTGGADPVTAPSTIYSYALGYAPNSNVNSVTDSVIGTWNYGYDGLNRLTTAQAAATPISGPAPYGAAHLAWTYDSFGNYKGVSLTGSTSLTMAQPSFSYNGSSLLNGVAQTSLVSNRMDGYNYDAAGNLLFDGVSESFSYDAEGRVSSVTNGTTTAYVYDAEGYRVAKESVSGSTVTLTNQYLLGLGGEQVSELDGSGNWLHTNVYAAGGQLATYDASGLHFHFKDWLGNRRVQGTGSIGTVEESCLNLPYGGNLQCQTPGGSAVGIGSGSDANDDHFTGKERDVESGLDYFGARYYASNMGRFISPDWSSVVEPVPYAKLGNPQSLNLYSYVLNSPMGSEDLDGHTNDPYGHGSNACAMSPLCTAEAEALDEEPGQQSTPTPAARQQTQTATPAPPAAPPPLTPEQQQQAAAAYAEKTTQTPEEAQAIASVIQNRIDSGQTQYVHDGSVINAHDLQGVGGTNYNAYLQGHAAAGGAQNATDGLRYVQTNGATTDATFFIVRPHGAPPTAQMLRNLGRVVPGNPPRVGDVFLFRPAPPPAHRRRH